MKYKYEHYSVPETSGMRQITAQAVQAYLDEHGYLTLAALAEATNTTPEKIRALEAAECIPATSYAVGGEMTFTSSFGTYRLPVAPERYYHPSIAAWVTRALSLADDHDLKEVAARVREDFDKTFHECLDGRPPPWPGGADYAWDFIIDGTWGLCLKDITVANLLTKECARETIRDIVRPEVDHQLPERDRRKLEAALAEFEKVALPFAPHEVGESCRNNEIRPAIEKYDLQVPAESDARHD